LEELFLICDLLMLLLSIDLTDLDLLRSVISLDPPAKHLNIDDGNMSLINKPDE